MQKKFILFGIVLVLFGVASRAAFVEGSCSSDSVQCDLQVNRLFVTNDSQLTQTFFPKALGEVADWVKVLPESLTLGAGESGVFEVYTIATCYADPGNYSAQVLISNSLEHSLACNITVEQGHFVGVDILPQENDVTQCKAAKYTIVLENNTIVPKQEKELVSLSVSGLARGWINLEKTQLIVEKGKRERVELVVSAPCNADLGDYKFEVKAALFNPNFFSKAQGVFSIRNGQEISVRPKEGGFEDFSKPFLSCHEKEFSHAVEIQNLGEQDDLVELEIKNAPQWIALSENSFALAKGEKKTILLSLKKNDAEQKLYSFELAARSAKFGMEKTTGFEVDLRDCYNVSVEKLSGEENACNEETLHYRFRLSNDGENSLDLKAGVEGLAAKISPGEFSLAPGDSMDLGIDLDVSGLGDSAKTRERGVKVEVVLDSSGSMDLKIGNEKKTDIAKNAVKSFVNSISAIDLGLRVFGQSEQCTKSGLLAPLLGLDVPKIESEVNALLPSGETPIAQTLLDAAADFLGGKENYIILVSDGKESCGGDLDLAAKTLSENKIKVFAIGFDIDETGKSQLEKIAQATGGKYFDATNANELSQIFGSISKELEIELSPAAEKTFSLKLVSENFSFEKDFLVNVSDCYNVALGASPVSVCRGIESKNSFTVSNLGSKEQSLSITGFPGWVVPQTDNVIVGAGKSMEIGFTLLPKTGSDETQFTLRAKSGHVNVFDSKAVNYLGDATCYGFGLEVEKNFTGRIGEGERRKINFSNNGQAKMAVSISADRDWVYFEPQKIEIEKGESGFVNFYITPPFDLLGTKNTVLLSTKNDFGFENNKEITLNVTGPGFGLIPANIVVTRPQPVVQPAGGQNPVTVGFVLSNDSEQPIDIYSVEAVDFNAQFEISNPHLEQNDSAKITMKAVLPNTESTSTDGSSTFEVKIKISSSGGIFSRVLSFELVPQEPPLEPAPNTGSAGLFTLANAPGAIMLLLLVIVIGLLIYSLIGTGKKPEEPKKFVLQEKTSRKPKAKKPVKEKAKPEKNKASFCGISLFKKLACKKRVFYY